MGLNLSKFIGFSEVGLVTLTLGKFLEAKFRFLEISSTIKGRALVNFFLSWAKNLFVLVFRPPPSEI